MSIQNEDEEISNILDKDNEISPISLNNNDIHEFTNNLGEDEYSPSPFILSDKSRPLFISNENFINYFMHIDYNTPLNRESINALKNNINILDEKSNLKSCSQSNSELPPKSKNSSNEKKNKSSILSKKSKKEKEYGILTDSKTGITYNEEDDPIIFKPILINCFETAACSSASLSNI